MKEIAMKLAVALGMVLFFVPFALAQYHFELTPSLTMGEQYDDNIFLTPDHKKSDYITTVSPGFNLDLVGHHTQLGVRYAPTFVWYQSRASDDTVRHAGTLTLGHDLAENLRFDLSDTYTKSEEPIETIDTIVDVRHTRRPYQRNTASASLHYIFGPENSITAGYRHSLLENDDPTIDDGREQNPFATATVWMNVKNGLEFSYAYTDATFSRDVGPPADDYTGQSGGVRYIYRFNPHQRCFVGYTLTTRNFDGATEDYKVHEGTVGYEQDVSRDLSVTLGAGYFRQENDRSSDESGPSYNAAITKRFQRGSVTIGGAGGWHEAYLEAERRGFSRYESVMGTLEYRLLEPLTGFAGGSLRHDKDDTGREWDTYQGNCGIRWAFLRWFTAGLEYRYAKRKDDVHADEFTDNQVMLTLTASRLFRW
jgi:Putative beta-barrel porin 2